MYQPHPDFEPPDDTTPLWRYVDFTKFVYLLETRGLWFTRADRFVDRFEGSFTFEDARRRRDWAPPVREEVGRQIEALRSRTCLSCWHRNEYESAAMWELYLKSDEGVAIRSTFPRMQAALRNADTPVHIGVVRYLDYDRESIPADTTFAPLLHKRRSFAHENEVRALVQRDGDDDDDDGRLVPCDLDGLIEQVFVSPHAPDWFQELVASISRRYGHGWRVVRSDLGRDPVY